MRVDFLRCAGGAFPCDPSVAVRTVRVRHISFGAKRERPQLLAVANIVVCAGREPVRDLEDESRRNGIHPHIIGGAAVAAELDAKQAIRQGTELAARL